MQWTIELMDLGYRVRVSSPLAFESGGESSKWDSTVGGTLLPSPLLPSFFIPHLSHSLPLEVGCLK